MARCSRSLDGLAHIEPLLRHRRGAAHAFRHGHSFDLIACISSGFNAGAAMALHGPGSGSGVCAAEKDCEK